MSRVAASEGLPQIGSIDLAALFAEALRAPRTESTMLNRLSLAECAARRGDTVSAKRLLAEALAVKDRFGLTIKIPSVLRKFQTSN